MFKKAVFFIFFTISVISFSSNKPLIFAFENLEDFPYYLGSNEVRQNSPGVAVEFFSKVAEMSLLPIEYKRMPWLRCLEELKNGKVDGVFYAAYIPSRVQYGNFPMKNGRIDDSRYFNKVNYSVYKLKNSNCDWNGKLFFNVSSIGILRGYAALSPLQKTKLNIQETNSEIANFKKLLSRRVDLVITLEENADFIIKNNSDFYEKIEKLDTPFISVTSYLMLSKSFTKANPQLAEKIWDAVREVRRKEYNKLYNKYVNKF